ncbi:hypothetical protein [Methylomagnum sp.]
MKTKTSLRACLPVLIGLAQIAPGTGLADQGHVYENEGKRYPYVVDSTGDNYTFEFETNPGREGGRLKALGHVFRSAYGDDSVAPQYSEVFMKEGAKCYVFEATFYSYRGCFLPNDYSPDKRDRFWGFVSRLPNAMWFLTRNILPAVLVVGGLFLVFRAKR